MLTRLSPIKEVMGGDKGERLMGIRETLGATIKSQAQCGGVLRVLLRNLSVFKRRLYDPVNFTQFLLKCRQKCLDVRLGGRTTQVGLYAARFRPPFHLCVRKI